MPLSPEEFSEYISILGLSENEKTVSRESRLNIFKTSNNLDENNDFQKSSMISDYFCSLSLPKTFKTSASFIYNFFEPSESVAYPHESFDQITQNILNNQNVSNVNFVDSSIQDQYFNFLKSKVSRQIKINIFPDSSLSNYEYIPKLTEEPAFSLASMDELNNIASVAGIKESIKTYAVYEDALSNKKFTGIEYFDTLKEAKIYNILSSSIIFQAETSNDFQISNEDSLTSIAEKFINHLSDDNNRFDKETKIGLYKVLSNLNQKNIFKKDKLIEAVNNPVSNISFTTKFNNLFFGDIINSSTILANSIYTDENEALLAGIDGVSASTIQQNAIIQNSDQHPPIEDFSGIPIPGTLKILSTDIYEAAYSDSTDINQDEFLIEASRLAENLKFLPSVKVLGYKITIYEISTNEIMYHDDIVILVDDDTVKSILYNKIKYGKSYLIKIRTIYFVETVYEVQVDNEEVELASGAFYVLSDSNSELVECIERIPPEPPDVLKVRMNFEEQKPVLTWEFPFNKQRDIKKFEVYKRRSINEPFTLVQFNNFDNSAAKYTSGKNIPQNVIVDCLDNNIWPNQYIDFDFDIKKQDSAIYAVVSVDAHGMTSGYSTQLFVKYDKINNKFITKIISSKGAPQPYPNLLLKQDFFIDVIKESNFSRCNIFFDPEYFSLLRTTEDGTEEPVDYLEFTEAQDEIKFPYQFHFINVDQQLDQVFNVKIINKSGLPTESIPNVNINKNLTFDF